VASQQILACKKLASEIAKQMPARQIANEKQASQELASQIANQYQLVKQVINYYIIKY